MGMVIILLHIFTKIFLLTRLMINITLKGLGFFHMNCKFWQGTYEYDKNMNCEYEQQLSMIMSDYE